MAANRATSGRRRRRAGSSGSSSSDSNPSNSFLSFLYPPPPTSHPPIPLPAAPLLSTVRNYSRDSNAGMRISPLLMPAESSLPLYACMCVYLLRSFAARERRVSFRPCLRPRRVSSDFFFKSSRSSMSLLRISKNARTNEKLSKCDINEKAVSEVVARASWCDRKLWNKIVVFHAHLPYDSE